MKIKRNEPCPCASGKKYKHCCMNSSSKQQGAVIDDIQQIALMNPNLSLEDLNIVAQQKIETANNSAHSDFCGLSPAQMHNWLYAPFYTLKGVTIDTPDDVKSCPVMRYLSIILDEAIQNSGAFKATSKGNLPTKIVKQACELLPEFAIAQFEQDISISEYAGSNEDKFNALHYTRILAEITGIIHLRNGRYYLEQSAQAQYQEQGIQAFFMPMLETATTQYNWAYFDAWEEDIDLRTFWLFMLWRLQTHTSLEQLRDEVITAFPDLLEKCPSSEYLSPTQLLESLISSRFIRRFLEFWGFITLDPRHYIDRKKIHRKANIQPLMKHTFRFDV